MSQVGTRQDPAKPAPGRTGFNTLQWQLGPTGWQLLSLHVAMERVEAPLDPGGPTCLAG